MLLRSRPLAPQAFCPDCGERLNPKKLSPETERRRNPAIVADQALAGPPVELAVERVVELAEATMLPLPRIVTL